jgi:ubiquitin carboxyl-terminal hydrolase 36/42
MDGAAEPVETAKENPISTAWTQKYKRPPGLRNFSNTCYMNSTLQALMHVPPLVAYLLSGRHGTRCIASYLTILDWLGDVKEGCVLCLLEKHARDSYDGKSEKDFIEPTGIVRKNGGTSLLVDVLTSCQKF